MWCIPCAVVKTGISEFKSCLHLLLAVSPLANYVTVLCLHFCKMDILTLRGLNEVVHLEQLFFLSVARDPLVIHIDLINCNKNLKTHENRIGK